MNIDKTARTTLIITNIIIWSLISIVLFFFGIIYVNAETYDTNRFRYLTNKNGGNQQVEWNANAEMNWNGSNNNWGIEYEIAQTQGTIYRGKAEIYLSVDCGNNCTEKQAKDKIQLYSITNATNVKQVNVEKIADWYACYFNSICWKIKLTIQFTYTASSPTYIDIKLATDNAEFISVPATSGFINRLSIEMIGTNTTDILNNINNDTYSIDGNVYSILQEQFNIQNLMRTFINNNYDQLDNQFDLLNGILNGTYQISNINGNPQFTNMVSGENRIFAKLGGDPSFNQTFDNTQFKGGNFIWGMINRLINNYAWLSAIIVLGISLKIISQALGRK